VRTTNQSNKLNPIIPTITALLMISSYPSTLHAAPPWEQTHRKFATDGVAGGFFGFSVAADGNLVVVGAYGDNDRGDDTGSAYVFDVTTRQPLFKLLASDGKAHDWFGYSSAISGNVAVIGARFDRTGSGSAYIFDVTTGEQRFKLIADDGHANDEFGFSVSISGNIAVVGAHFADDLGNGSGSAYAFDATTGQQLFKLLASDGAAGDGFGYSVAVSGNLAVIGSPFDDDRGSESGSAYVFDVTTGQQIAKLLPVSGRGFGHSVAMSGNLAVIGGEGNSLNGRFSGSASVFDVMTGQQLFMLLPSDGAINDHFGTSVSISGNKAVIGAYQDKDNGGASGSAYIFDVTTGEQLSKLLAADGDRNDYFGNSVAISDSVAVIGTPNNDIKGRDSGSAYVFELRTTNYLTVDPFPLRVGQDGTFSFVKGLPDKSTWLLYSVAGLKRTYLPNLNVTVDIENPMIAHGPRSTDENGNLQFVLPVPIRNSPINIWFQTVQHNNVTNFFRTQIVP